MSPSVALYSQQCIRFVYFRNTACIKELILKCIQVAAKIKVYYLPLTLHKIWKHQKLSNVFHASVPLTS